MNWVCFFVFGEAISFVSLFGAKGWVDFILLGIGFVLRNKVTMLWVGGLGTGVFLGLGV